MTNKEKTLEHIRKVQLLLKYFLDKLTERSENHDISKLVDEESEVYSKEVINTIHAFDHPEYEHYLNKIRISIETHYSKNRHHPEHFSNSINDMNLIDIIEMFCDWCSCSSLDQDLSIKDQLMRNKRRYNISEQLNTIFLNTAKVIGIK